MDGRPAFPTQRAVKGRTKTLGGLAGLLLALSGCYTGASVDANAGGETDGAADAGPSGGPGGSGADGGDGGEGGDTGEPAASCLDALEPTALRRLSPEQARNTVRDLFGVPDLEITYEDEAEVITELGVRQLRSTADAVIAARDTWTLDVYGCDTAGAADDACTETFIRNFGPKVFRRPITEAEVDLLMSVYENAAYGEQLSYADSLDVVLSTMLQAPGFIYVMETGTPVEDAAGTVIELDGYSVANRLSYFLWDSMPDDALFAAAEAGELGSPAGISAQVERMLQSPRAKDRIRKMVTKWLHIDGVGLRIVLEDSVKDPDLYPEFSPALMDAMRIEVEALVDRALLEGGDAGFETLMTSREAYVNASLAELYGVQGPADDDSWAWVTLPEEERAGILTRAAFLTVHAGQRVQSPIFRGVYVIEEILCGELGDPPPTANNTPVDQPEDPDAGPMTVREMVDARTMNDATCAACHSLINPPGFLFEHYDALGRWRSTEVQSGLEIDAVAELTMGDVAGPMPDALAMSRALVDSSDARACFAKKWAEIALDAETFDPCTEEEVVAAFVQSGDVNALLEGIVRSPAFRYVRVQEEE